MLTLDFSILHAMTFSHLQRIAMAANVIKGEWSVTEIYKNGTVSNVSENLMFTLCCLNCSVFRLHLICSWHLMLTCICRPSPAGSTAPTVMRPTVFPRMEPSSCTRSSVVHWMTLSLCCGRLGPVARATPCAHTASAIRLSETWRKVGTKSDSW